jgi:hypothetical protein
MPATSRDHLLKLVLQCCGEPRAGVFDKARKFAECSKVIKDAVASTLLVSLSTASVLKVLVDRPDDAAESRLYDLFIDIVAQMLVYDPAERITPDAALEHPFCLSMSPS